jgi:hypothetical protein
MVVVQANEKHTSNFQEHLVKHSYLVVETDRAVQRTSSDQTQEVTAIMESGQKIPHTLTFPWTLYAGGSTGPWNLYRAGQCIRRGSTLRHTTVWKHSKTPIEASVPSISLPV